MEPLAQSHVPSSPRLRRAPATPLVIAEQLTAGVPPAAIARCLARPEPWVRQHVDLVAPGVRALFVSGRFRSLAAYTGFLELPAVARRRILDAGGRITVARCAQLRRAENAGKGGGRPRRRVSR